MSEMLQLSARHTINGNPRRLYVLVRNGRIVHAWNEDAVPTRYRQMTRRALPLATTVGEYRAVLSEGATA